MAAVGGIAPLRSSYIGRGASNSLEEPGVGAREDSSDFASSLLSCRSFYFAERSKRIDLEKIRGLDLAQIEADVDVEALQRHLEELTFGDLGKSVAQPLGVVPRDDDFLKLFRLSQLTVEYLLNVQDVLAEGLETSSRKCREASARIDRYKKKAVEADARVKVLKAELKAKRGAGHTYESLVSQGKAASRERRRRRHDPSLTEDSFGAAAPRTTESTYGGELTLYVTDPEGGCTKHTVEGDSTASELADRLGGGRLVHRGVELGPDASLGAVGVRDGDTLLSLTGAASRKPGRGPWSSGSGTGMPHSEEENDQLYLDGRIADLEASIRSEMAVQVQTQLASLRGSLPGSVQGSQSLQATGGWGEAAAGGGGGGGANCVAGALEEDDDENEVSSSPGGDGSISAPNRHEPPSDAFRDASSAKMVAAVEDRLRAQISSLEAKLDALAQNAARLAHKEEDDKAPAQRSSPTPQKKSTPPATPRRDPESPPAKEEAPTPKPSPAQEAATSWTVRCAVVSRGIGEALEARDEDAVVEIEAQDTDSLVDICAALAIDLDIEIDRIVLRDAQTGGKITRVQDLRSAPGVICHVVRGRIVGDDHVDNLRVLRAVLAETNFGQVDQFAKKVATKKLEAAIAARQAAWRNMPANHGAASALNQAEVARLEVRINALDALLETVENQPGFDDEMLRKLQAALTTVCDGIPPSVQEAIHRVRAQVDERANLVAASNGRR